MSTSVPTTGRVIVIGSGLAGLAAANSAARGGADVVVFEARSEIGGRARSFHGEGFVFNQGPHALYKAGAGAKVLRELGVAVDGRAPSLTATGLAFEGRVRRAASWSAARRATLKFWTAVLRRDAVSRARGVSMSEWIDDFSDPFVGQLAGAFTRLASYASEFDDAEASEFLRQLRRSARGVTYLHGGWQSLVDALRSNARSNGVTFTEAKITRVQREADSWVAYHDTTAEPASAVVIACGGPGHAASLLGDTSAQLTKWASNAKPVVAACLDVALDHLPAPKEPVVIGVDEPTYLIDHARAARLSPTGGALVHAMRYGAPESESADIRASLESMLERSQPGWRDALVTSRFSRQLVVTHDYPKVGSNHRPDIALPDTRGAFVAGDWITTNGMLADAALDSGARAGNAAARAAGFR